jgi:hypothetical protein
MLSILSLLITSFVVNISQPILHGSSEITAIASSRQCCCCANNACSCGMEKTPKPEPQKPEKSKESGPCCGNTRPVSPPENCTVIGWFPYLLQEIRQNTAAFELDLAPFGQDNRGLRYFNFSSASPPGSFRSLPLRI